MFATTIKKSQPCKPVYTDFFNVVVIIQYTAYLSGGVLLLVRNWYRRTHSPGCDFFHSVFVYVCLMLLLPHIRKGVYVMCVTVRSLQGYSNAPPYTCDTYTFPVSVQPHIHKNKKNFLRRTSTCNMLFTYQGSSTYVRILVHSRYVHNIQVNNSM